MKKTDYLQKRKEIIRECEGKLETLDKAFILFGGTPVETKSNGHSNSADGSWPFDISKREAVRMALKHVAVSTFGAKEVRTAMAKEFPDMSKAITDNQLSAILSTFAAHKKQIKIHTEKSGRSPAVYEHIKQAQDKA